MILVKRVNSKHIEYIDQQSDVTHDVELHIIFKAVTLKVGDYVLSVDVVGFRTLFAYQLVEKYLFWRKRKFVIPNETVHVVVAKNALPLDKLNV